VAGQPVSRLPIDPCLLIGEVSAVATELSGRATEGVQRRIAGIAGLERQIEGLAEVLREKAEGIDTLRAGNGVGIFEDLFARALQPRTECSPRRLQCRVVGTVTESHRHAPSLLSNSPTTSHARRADSKRPSWSILGPMSSRSKPCG